MKYIEIPHPHERSRRYKLLEKLPGLLTWSILLLPVILSNLAPHITVFFIISYLLLWFVKALALNIRAIQGFRMMDAHKKLPWQHMLKELAELKVTQPESHIPTWHYENIIRIKEQATPIEPDSIMHAVIIAAYKESREVLEPTIQSVLDSDYDMGKVILVVAYEERGGEEIQSTVKGLIKDYGKKFKHAMGVQHPKDIPGEVIGKGGNITFAARELVKYIEKSKIDPRKVIVTTLDSDNRPHHEYLAALSYLYSVAPNPVKVSFQPIPVYTNNIWDAPAPMRVIATGNTFWNVVLSLRPHMIRNFASHAQCLQTLIDTDYWSVRTIVEDGHQFWRTYFRYDGDHAVYPLYLPIGQDAVLSTSYWRTLKAQFVQLRRWAWGASDVAYVAEMGFFRSNKVPKLDLVFKFFRLLEGHVSWATAPFILAFAAFIPILFNPQDFAANQLPLIASRIQTIALGGILITLFLSLKLLPPKPARYKRRRSLIMVAQWVLLPATTILYNGFSALYSQTRLLFGRYMDKFDVTDKVVVTADKKKII